MRGVWSDTRKNMDGNDDWEVLREPLLDVQPLSPSSGSESSPRDIVLVSRSGSGDADVHAGSPQAASAVGVRTNSVALVANDRGLRLTALGSIAALEVAAPAAPAAASSSALTLPSTSPRRNPLGTAGWHGTSAPTRLSIGMGVAGDGAVGAQAQTLARARARARQQGGGAQERVGGEVSYGRWCCCCWL